MAFTAQKPILFDFDNGAHRAGNRKDLVRVSSWSELDSLTRSDLDPYNTVIIDTVGRAIDALSKDVIKKNAKHGNGGVPSLQGWGVVKARFIAWLDLIKSYHKDVILIAHMNEQKRGDDLIERLDIPGGSKNEVYKSSDAMGRIFLSEANGDKRVVKRELDFSPRPNSFGKNPAGYDLLEIPHFNKAPLYMAEVIQGIKDAVNHQTAEQQQAQQIIEEWRDKVNEFKTPEEFNGALEEATKAGNVVKAILWDKAKKLNLSFNKETNSFYIAEEAKA